MTPYDAAFMEYTAGSSAYSAKKIVNLLRPITRPASVLDVGCAVGTWLSFWSDSGTEIFGVDGDYVDQTRLEIPRDRFHAVDLAKPFDLGRQFDLVQSLEVAEHLPPSASAAFVANLIAQSRGLILFSAAQPNQGGAGHINEQPLEFWRVLFARHDFYPCDTVRPRIREDRNVSFWYRFNVLLYVRRDRIAPELLPIPDSDQIRDFRSPAFKARQALVSVLPARLHNAAANIRGLAVRSLPTRR